MKHILPLLLLSAPLAFAQMPTPSATPAPAPPTTLRSILLAQLRSTHNVAEWFVPVNTAVAGLTAEQAKWVPRNAEGKLDPNANHSVGMLAYHLWFWNSQSLAKLKGEQAPKPPSNNDETFNDYDTATWNKTVADLDRDLTAIEHIVETADDAKLARIANGIQHISAHNAYHTGQILYVRKLQGTWNPANGVK